MLAQTVKIKKYKTEIYTQTKISIIIPTYFEEKMVGSLLQKFDDKLKEQYNFELIVSDGGSADDTVEIAKKHADKVVEKEKTGKQTIAEGRNEGRNAADGDVLVFLNADCEPKDIDLFFKHIYDFAHKKRDIGAIACKVCAFEDEEIFKDKVFYFLHNNYVKFLNFIGIGMGRGECQIIKKDVFDDVNGYNPELTAGEDFDLYRRIVKAGYKVEFSEKILIKESSRRFRKYGYLRIIWQWTLNALGAVWFKKAASKEWEAVRYFTNFIIY